MEISVMAPSADTVSASRGGSYSRQIGLIEVSLIYRDRQCLIVFVIFSIMYIALIKAQTYNWCFVINFERLRL